MAELLFAYTSGYPVLVSKLCKLMDERVGLKEEFASRIGPWTRQGFLEAVKMLLMENCEGSGRTSGYETGSGEICEVF